MALRPFVETKGPRRHFQLGGPCSTTATILAEETDYLISDIKIYVLAGWLIIWLMVGRYSDD